MAVLKSSTRAPAVLAVVLALGPLGPAAAATAPALEYAVKANYLYKFGPFVEWPAAAFDSPTAPFNVCVLGADPFGRALDDAIRGQTVDGHPVAVRRLPQVSKGLDCHVLYVGRSGSQKAAEALRLLRDTPVLTVTDEQQGVDGGIVHFVLQNGRVRFTIDVAAAQASGLILSSKLLGLAAAPAKSGG